MGGCNGQRQERVWRKKGGGSQAQLRLCLSLPAVSVPARPPPTCRTCLPPPTLLSPSPLPISFFFPALFTLPMLLRPSLSPPLPTSQPSQPLVPAFWLPCGVTSAGQPVWEEAGRPKGRRGGSLGGWRGGWRGGGFSEVGAVGLLTGTVWLLPLPVPPPHAFRSIHAFLTIDVIVHAFCEPEGAAVAGSGQRHEDELCVGGGTDEEEDGGRVSCVASWHTRGLGEAESRRGGIHLLLLGGAAWGGARRGIS